MTTSLFRNKFLFVRQTSLPCYLARERTSFPFPSACFHTTTIPHQELEGTELSHTEEKLHTMYEPAQEQIDYFVQKNNLEFIHPSVLMQALTHKSFLRGNVPTNERLNQLGQRVMDLYISEFIYLQFKNRTELRSKKLDFLAKGQLAETARLIGLDKVVRWTDPSSNPKIKKGETKILYSTFNALVGAIYHEKGSMAARDFIKKNVIETNPSKTRSS